jgi:hypothetical protein
MRCPPFCRGGSNGISVSAAPRAPGMDSVLPDSVDSVLPSLAINLCMPGDKMPVTVGVVHANVGQKLLICYPFKSFLRWPIKVSNTGFKTQTITNAVVKPLNHMLFLLLSPPNKLYTHLN